MRTRVRIDADGRLIEREPWHWIPRNPVVALLFVLAVVLGVGGVAYRAGLRDCGRYPMRAVDRAVVDSLLATVPEHTANLRRISELLTVTEQRRSQP